MVSNIHPSDSSYPAFLTKVNNKILFRADDGARGYELWSLVSFEHSAYVPIVVRGCCD